MAAVLRPGACAAECGRPATVDLDGLALCDDCFLDTLDDLQRQTEDLLEAFAGEDSWERDELRGHRMGGLRYETIRSPLLCGEDTT